MSVSYITNFSVSYLFFYFSIIILLCRKGNHYFLFYKHSSFKTFSSLYIPQNKQTKTKQSCDMQQKQILFYRIILFFIADNQKITYFCFTEKRINKQLK